MISSREDVGDNGRWRRALEATPDVLIVIDPGATIRYVSPSMTRVLGHAPEECVGRHLYELAHPDDIPIALGSLVGTVGTGPGVKQPVEVRARHRDRSWRRLELLADNRINDPDIGAIILSCRDVTDGETVLAESTAESLYRVHTLLEHSSDVILQIDAQGTVSYASPAVERVLGYSDPALLGAANALDFIHPDDRERTIATLVEAASRSEVTPLMLIRVAHADGSWRTLEAVAQSRLDDPVVGAVIVNARDVTEREHAAKAAVRLTEVLEASHQVVVLSDPSGVLIYANGAARRLLGLERLDDRPVHVRELSSRTAQERLRKEAMPYAREHGVWTGELMLRAADGREIPVAATVQTHRDDANDRVELVSTIAHDITELKHAHERLRHQANHDQLTGLPNRTRLSELLTDALSRARRAGDQLAILFVDLDDFKAVNDVHGHAEGDAVLAEIAHRLRIAVRESDAVVRFGGDEFVVVCEAIGGVDEAREVAGRVIAAVEAPIPIEGIEVSIGASIGIVCGKANGDSTDLLRNADVALYLAKSRGGRCAEVFGESVEPVVS